MKQMTRAWIVTLLVTTTSPAMAQDKTLPPEPVPLGTARVFQFSNQYPPQAQKFTFYTAPPSTEAGGVVQYPYPYYPSPYPFGSFSPTFGLYSWDVGVYNPVAYGWYPYSIVVNPSVYRYPLPSGRVWIGYFW